MGTVGVKMGTVRVKMGTVRNFLTALKPAWLQAFLHFQKFTVNSIYKQYI